MKKIFTNIISCFVFICVLSLVLLNLHSISYADDDENIKADATVKSSEKSMSDNIKDEEIKQFINDYFEKKMDEYNVPGTQVAVVRNNSELLKSSYGYADLKTQEKVDMDNTTFPAASVSKLFTAVAIMQL